MKTAMKLNKKELLSLYEKSNDMIKKNLRMEFGEGFFVQDEVKPAIAITISKSKPQSKNKWFGDWEMIFDFTPILRLAIYICLVWIILK